MEPREWHREGERQWASTAATTGTVEERDRRRAELIEALSTHGADLRARGIDPDRILELCDPLYLFTLATARLMEERAQAMEAASRMAAGPARMVRDFYGLLDDVRNHLIAPSPPAHQPVMSTGQFAGSQTSVGSLYLAGFYIVWRDLDPTLWPTYLMFIPILIQGVIDLELAILQTSGFDALCLWRIGGDGGAGGSIGAIDKAVLTLSSVIIVLPPIITPAFGHEDYYPENVQLKSRIFMLGVPLTGFVGIKPPTNPTGGAPVGAVAPLRGRPVTGESLFTSLGMQAAIGDLQRIGVNLAGKIVMDGVGAVADAATSYVLDFSETALKSALDQIENNGSLLQIASTIGGWFKSTYDFLVAIPGLGDVVRGVATAATGIASGLVWLAQQLHRFVLFLAETFGGTDRNGKPIPAGQTLDKWIYQGTSVLILYGVNKAKAALYSEFVRATSALRAQAIVTTLAVGANSTTTIVVREAAAQGGLARAIRPGWLVYIGNDKRVVLAASPDPVAVDGTALTTLTLDAPVSAIEGTGVTAVPPGDIASDAYAAIFQGLGSGASRAGVFVRERAYDQINPTLYGNVANAIRQTDHDAQHQTIKDTIGGVAKDFSSRPFGVADYNELEYGHQQRFVVRLPVVGSGDAVAVSGGNATWTIANGQFTKDDIGRVLQVAGTTNPTTSGDFTILAAPDPVTAITGGVNIVSEALDPARVMVKVVEVRTVEPAHTTAASAIGVTTDFLTSILVGAGIGQIVDAVTQTPPGATVQDIYDARQQMLAKFEQVLTTHGGPSISTAQLKATQTAQAAVSTALKTNLFGNSSGALAALKQDLSTRATALYNQMLDEVEMAATQALADVFARTFIFAAMVGFELSDGEAVEGGGLLVDWAAVIMVFCRIHGNVAIKNSPTGDGGGALIRGSLPNIYLFNQIDHNRADGAGGGLYGQRGAWPILVLNDISHNIAERGGGLAFGSSTFPLILWNDISRNTAVDGTGTGGIGGGVWHDGPIGFFLANDITHNHAVVRGGGMCLDGKCWALWNDIDRNWCDGDGGGVYERGRGWFGINDIAKNFAGGLGGGICAEGAVSHGGNQIRGNQSRGPGGGVAVIGRRSASDFTDDIGGNRAPIGGGVYVAPTASVDLGGSDISANVAELDGGGLYLDGVAGTPPFGTLGQIGFSVNRAGGNGGGIFANRDLEIVSCAVIGNLAGGDGGGVYASDRGSVVLRTTVLEANLASSGGGACVRSTVALELERNLIKSNRAEHGVGGGLLAERTSLVTSDGDTFQLNLTAGKDGAGACVRDGDRLVVADAFVLSNTTSLEATHVAGPQPAGGGICARNVASVVIDRLTAGLNAAELGGATALIDCGDVRIVRSSFTSNAADHDRDGLGYGGAIYATGRGTTIRIGGDVRRGESNTFDDNIAGTAEANRVGGMASNEADGGAIAIIGGPIAIIEGNALSGNACTDHGGAICLTDTGPGSRVGGDNDAPPAALGGRRFGNTHHDNCAQWRWIIRHDPCCGDPPFRTIDDPHYTLLVDEPPVTVTTPVQSDAPPPRVTEDVPRITDDPTAHVPTDVPCTPWIFYQPPQFQLPVRPTRTPRRRRVQWLLSKPILKAIDDAYNQLPIGAQFLLFATGLLSGGASAGGLDIYSEWPDDFDHEDGYPVSTGAAPHRMGWPPDLGWRPSNAGGAAPYQPGRVKIVDSVRGDRIGPIITKHGGGVAIRRGLGTEVLGNRFERNYAAQHGGGCYIEGSNARTVVGVASASARFGRNDFVNNTSTFGGALALVGGTRARVIWNHIGGSSEQANYATVGGGICVIAAAPAIGAPGDTTELIGNYAGHHISLLDGGLLPKGMHDLARAGVWAAGGGLAIIGPIRGSGPIIEHVPIRANRVVGPAGLATLLPVPLAGTIHVLGGGVALLRDAHADVRTCTLEANEVLGTEDVQHGLVTLGGGGVAIAFDTAGAIAPFRARLLDLVVRDNVVRQPLDDGKLAGRRLVAGGGIACIEATGPVIADCLVRGNHAVRELPDGELLHLPKLTLSLYGGGIAARSSERVLIERTRVERNSISDIDRPVVPERYEGGGIAIEGGGVRVRQSWLVGNFSQGDGGGLALRATKTSTIDHVTIADNDAVSRGVAVVAGGDLTGTQILRSILDGHGAWDNAGVFGLKDQIGLVVRGSCLWYPTGASAFGGTLAWDPAAHNVDADPGFQSPDRVPDCDYSVMHGSPALHAGWQRTPPAGTYHSELRRVPAQFASIADALATARPGTIVEVGPGHYTELFTVPDGIVLRTTDGPAQTFLELPPLPPPPAVPPRVQVALGRSRRRAAFVGFTIDGRFPLVGPPPPLPPGVPPPRRPIDDSLAVDPHYQGYVTRTLIYGPRQGIVVRALAPSSAPPPHALWICGVTVARCESIGIHVEALRRGSSALRLHRPCRVDPPKDPRTFVFPTIMPMLEHNIVAFEEPHGVGIVIEGHVPVPTDRVQFQTVWRNQADQSGIIGRWLRLADNVRRDPSVRDPSAIALDFRLVATPPSPCIAAQSPDERYCGALTER